MLLLNWCLKSHTLHFCCASDRSTFVATTTKSIRLHISLRYKVNGVTVTSTRPSSPLLPLLHLLSESRLEVKVLYKTFIYYTCCLGVHIGQNGFITKFWNKKCVGVVAIVYFMANNAMWCIMVAMLFVRCVIFYSKSPRDSRRPSTPMHLIWHPQHLAVWMKSDQPKLLIHSKLTKWNIIGL